MTSLGKCSRYQTVLCIQGGLVPPLDFSASWAVKLNNQREGVDDMVTRPTRGAIHGRLQAGGGKSDSRDRRGYD
jgi:hypothetical protein